ncbi:ABC transporter ATP-binding protein [Pelomonas sp. HMWF004]|nr:ABC transporter ATP-binding protein [Pelomonas sp. HMWF004]
MGQAALVEAPAAPLLLAAASSAAPEVVVAVSGFVKRYGKTVACHGIDLQIHRGEIFGLIGPDGAGKSSLMKAVAGVLSFEGGTVDVFGQRVDSERSAEKVKSRIGLMPQGLGQNLYGELSVDENIDFFARLHLVPKAQLHARKEQLLQVTRLAAFRERPMKHLSGGMKQKLGLVCTLIHGPELVILDEPTTGVDPVSRRDFWAILGELLREQGVTALVSTAYMDEASRFHRVALFHAGKVLAQGAPDDIRTLATGSVVTVQATPQMAALDQLTKRFAQVEALGASLRVFADGADEATAATQVREALAGLDCSALETTPPELEDVFIALLRQRGLVAMAPANPAATPGPATPPARAAPAGLAIEAKGLTRTFNGFRAVDGVSFSVPPGQIFGLLGANGAGKSTVIKMLTGIVRPDAGQGRVAGADMLGAGIAIKQRIGYMSQAFSLYTDLTVVENIRLYAGIYGLGRAETPERVQWVVSMAGLQGLETQRTAGLPMGQRQRLTLGCALVHRPQVLFLDEPTSGVDPVGRRAFWDVLFHLSRQEQVAMLVTTHYMSEAEHCDHLALMYAGRVVADATPAAMKQAVAAEAGHLLEVACSDAALALTALRKAGLAEVSLYGRMLHVLSKQPDVDTPRITQALAAAGLNDVKVTPRSLTMEDVFVYRVTALESQDRAAGSTPAEAAA